MSGQRVGARVPRKEDDRLIDMKASMSRKGDGYDNAPMESRRADRHFVAFLPDVGQPFDTVEINQVIRIFWTRMNDNPDSPKARNGIIYALYLQPQYFPVGHLAEMGCVE